MSAVYNNTSLPDDEYSNAIFAISHKPQILLEMEIILS